MNPIESYLKSYIINQDFLIQLLPQGPTFSTDYMNNPTNEEIIKKVSADYTMKIFSEVQSKEKAKIRTIVIIIEEITTTEEGDQQKIQESIQNYSVSQVVEFEIERAYVPYTPPTIISNTSFTLEIENTFSKLEELTLDACFPKNKNVIDYSINNASEISLFGKPYVHKFNLNSLCPDIFSLEIYNNKKKENYISFFSSFEIRSPMKVKLPNYIIKEENFSLTLIRKELPDSLKNLASASSDFCPPKNFKIVNSKPDLLSQSIQDKSAFKIDSNETKTQSQFNKYQYTTTKSDLNKSEIIVENELNNTTANIHQNDLDSSITLNKSNNEVKKTEKLIELLNSKLEAQFEKFERDEITPEQINDIVKRELTPLRPLFISSKNIKEKVFVALSKGNNDKYMFLNHVFKTIIEDSLKNINIKNSTYNIRPVTASTKISVQMPKLSNDDLTQKKAIMESQKALNYTSHNPVKESPIKMSPVKKKQPMNANYDSNQRKSPNPSKGIHTVNIINDKSINTKNKININFQSTYKKDKNEFSELPYIK